MKKFVIPIAAILALTAMAIAFSSMTTPAPVKAEAATPAIQAVNEVPAMGCCDKPTPAVVAEEKDCSDCPEAKKADCSDCADKDAPKAEAVSF